MQGIEVIEIREGLNEGDITDLCMCHTQFDTSAVT